MDDTSDSETAYLLHKKEEKIYEQRPLLEDLFEELKGWILHIKGLLLPLVVQLSSFIRPAQSSSRDDTHRQDSSPTLSPNDTMKVLRPVFFILAASQVVDAHPAELQEGPFTGEVTVSNAIPASDFNLEEYFDKGDLSSPVLDKRSTCQVIDRVIRKIGTNQNKVVYITSGASLGLAICNLTHADQCNMVGLAIGASLSIIFALANDYSGGEPVPVPELPGPASLKEGTYMSAVKAAMSSSALEYAEILPAPLHDTTEKRSDDEPDLLERFLIKGLRSADNTTGHNIFVHHYSNGGSVLHVPVSDDVATDNLHKRYDHPGLKISYTTRMKSSLPKSRQRDMASSIGSMWEYYAKTARMDEYIGFEEENGKANFYFRIIPETRGFGENYESVDVCGGMAGYL